MTPSNEHHAPGRAILRSHVREAPAEFLASCAGAPRKSDAATATVDHRDERDSRVGDYPPQSRACCQGSRDSARVTASAKEARERTGVVPDDAVACCASGRPTPERQGPSPPCAGGVDVLRSPPRADNLRRGSARRALERSLGPLPAYDLSCIACRDPLPRNASGSSRPREASSTARIQGSAWDIGR